MCPVGRMELDKIITSFKNNKAAGPHLLKADLVKMLSRGGRRYVRTWLNRVLSDGTIDPYLNEGRVVLIFKKGSRFDPLSYRPITLGTILSKLVACLLTTRMSKIIERERLFDDLQMGFRKQHSASDPILLTSVILDKAKKQKSDVHLVMVDIKAAYDTVCRGELFHAMDNFGFGGPTYTLFRSLYKADFIKFEVNGYMTKKMFLSVGLKQGCSTSPMAYNIFKRDFVARLNRAERGYKIDGMSVTAIFYADDVIIFGRSRQDALDIFQEFRAMCSNVGLSINMKKSKVVTGDEMSLLLKKIAPEPLELVIVQDYLGAPLQISNNLFQVAFSQSRAVRAERHSSSCISLAASAPDPILFATNIWRSVAIPSVLYAADVLLLRQSEIKKIESEEANVARFALQLPSCSANVVAYTLAGMRPFRIVYWERVLRNLVRIKGLPSHHLARRALTEAVSLGKSCNYNRMVNRISDEINWGGDIESLDSCLDLYCSNMVNKMCAKLYKSCNLLRRTTIDAPVHQSIFLKFNYVSRCYHEFITYNTGLGNRYPIIKDYVIKMCPLCLESGDENKLYEPHILFACNSVSELRETLGLTEFASSRRFLGPDLLYKEYWNHTIGRRQLLSRIHNANQLRSLFMKKMMSCLTCI